MENPKYARKCIYAFIEWPISVFNHEPCGFEIKCMGMTPPVIGLSLHLGSWQYDVINRLYDMIYNDIYNQIGMTHDTWEWGWCCLMCGGWDCSMSPVWSWPCVRLVECCPSPHLMRICVSTFGGHHWPRPVCPTTCNFSAAVNDQGWNKTSSHPDPGPESWCAPCLCWSGVMCLYPLCILLYCCTRHYCSLAWNFLIKARINKWWGEDHHYPTHHHHPLSAVLGSSRIVIGVTK